MPELLVPVFDQFRTATIRDPDEPGVTVGLCCRDGRIDSAAISRGFLKEIGLPFVRNQDKRFPKEVESGRVFGSIGFAEIPVTFSENPLEIWKLEVRVIDHRRLTTFDEEQLAPESDRWFDLLIGRNVLNALKRERALRTATGTLPELLDLSGGKICLDGTVDKSKSKETFQNPRFKV
jgi:hypothetical protein